jgi:hypothetical protein
VLAILPGQGVGPIRFGATVETIERLMEAPCDVKTETVCRFVDRALEFTLANGALVEVLIHRRDRPAAPLPGQSPQLPSTFGAYNGALPPDPDTGAKLPVDFGMHRQAVEEALGKPQRIERVEANPNGTVERLSYPGLVLELDEYPAAREPVVGGFRVIKKK